MPGLLLMDLKMDGSDGFDLLEWLATRPDLNAMAVAVLTGSSMPEDMQKALEFGADDYYVKPPNYGELRSIVRQVSARFLTVNLPPTTGLLSQLHASY